VGALLVECLATFRPTEGFMGLVLVRIEPLPQESGRKWGFDVCSTSQIIDYKTSFSRIISCRTFCPPGPNIKAEDPMTDQAEIWKRIREGDRKEFEAFYNAKALRILQFLCRMTGKVFSLSR
jgi:hypothetical protein